VDVEGDEYDSLNQTSEGSIRTTLFRATQKLRFQLAGFYRREGIFDEARCDT
jgi:hypothetical protein